MKIDRQNISINVFIILAVIIFLLTWVFGVGQLVIYILILLGICALSLFGFISWLIRRVPPSAMIYVLIMYLGVSFISLSKFKTDIANWNVDINMIGVGLALVALAIVLSTRRKEQKPDDKNSVENSTPEVSNESEKTMTGQELPSIDIVLDEGRRKIDFQFEQIDGLDTKSGIVLGISGVVLTLVVTSLSNQFNSIINTTLVQVALIPILLSLILSLISIFVRKWDVPPQLERLASHYITEPANETKLEIIKVYLEAVQKNRKKIDRKIRFLYSSYFGLAIGLVLLAAWVGTLVWN